MTQQGHPDRAVVNDGVVISMGLSFWTRHVDFWVFYGIICDFVSGVVRLFLDCNCNMIQHSAYSIYVYVYEYGKQR